MGMPHSSFAPAALWKIASKTPFPGNTNQASTPHHKTDPDLFELHQASMRCSKEAPLDPIVLVDPEQYYRLPYQKKSMIAPLLGRINEGLNNRSAMLLVPGRIGTSSPELGIPVSYAEISEFEAICEVSCQSAGCQPEISNSYPNIYNQMMPSSPQYQHVIQIFDLTGREATCILMPMRAMHYTP